MSKAEEKFREAFERLKVGKPLLLDPSEAYVSQNNVAREAGSKDPSALRSDRYPNLTREIDQYIQANPKKASRAQQSTATKTVRRSKAVDKELLASLEKERNEARSKLLVAESIIIDLIRQNRLLQDKVDSGKVVPIRQP